MKYNSWELTIRLCQKKDKKQWVSQLVLSLSTKTKLKKMNSLFTDLF